MIHHGLPFPSFDLSEQVVLEETQNLLNYVETLIITSYLCIGKFKSNIEVKQQDTHFESHTVVLPGVESKSLEVACSLARLKSDRKYMGTIIIMLDNKVHCNVMQYSNI